MMPMSSRAGTRLPRLPSSVGRACPFTLACNVLENLGAANMAFTLLPMLSVGAVEALEHHGSKDQQAKVFAANW
jgi:alkylation response protein AidB-like acyl-CoA dehydrogenase